MSRRYVVAMQAYPEPFRRQARADMLATLHDGDRERGHASNREALSLLLNGTRERFAPQHAQSLLALLGLVLLFIAVAPDGLWIVQHSTGGPDGHPGGVAGPTHSEVRFLLAAAGIAAIAQRAPFVACLLAALTPYGFWVLSGISMGSGAGAFAAEGSDLAMIGLSVASALILTALSIQLAKRAPKLAVTTWCTGALWLAALSGTAAGLRALMLGNLSGGRGTLAAPVIGDLGVAFIACAAVLALSTFGLAQALSALRSAQNQPTPTSH